MDNWAVDDEVDLVGNDIGLENVFIENADGAGPPNQADQPMENNSGDAQNPYIYEVPSCGNGNNGECPAAAFWKQRCEQTMMERNRRLVEGNNNIAEIDRLSMRLTRAEKSVRDYQQRLFDTLNMLEPVRKELDDVKNQLLVEVRERSRYQCEAESHKASSVQLQAFVSEHEAKMAALRLQVTQLQMKDVEKAAEMRKFQEKAAQYEKKYHKTKEELKAMKEDCSRYRKAAENAGRGFRRRIRQSGRPIQQGSGPDISSDEDHTESGRMAEQLESELRRVSQRPVAPSPDRPISSEVPPTRVTGTVPDSAQAVAGPRTKAMAILERKEREEAEGTYVGNPKKIFRGAGRTLVIHPAPKLPKATSRSMNEPGRVRPSIEITAEDAMARVLAALRDVREQPPLSPIPDMPDLPSVASVIRNQENNEPVQEPPPASSENPAVIEHQSTSDAALTNVKALSEGERVQAAVTAAEKTTPDIVPEESTRVMENIVGQEANTRSEPMELDDVADQNLLQHPKTDAVRSPDRPNTVEETAPSNNVVAVAEEPPANEKIPPSPDGGGSTRSEFNFLPPILKNAPNIPPPEEHQRAPVLPPFSPMHQRDSSIMNEDDSSACEDNNLIIEEDAGSADDLNGSVAHSEVGDSQLAKETFVAESEGPASIPHVSIADMDTLFATPTPIAMPPIVTGNEDVSSTQPPAPEVEGAASCDDEVRPPNPEHGSCGGPAIEHQDKVIHGPTIEPLSPNYEQGNLVVSDGNGGTIGGMELNPSAEATSTDGISRSGTEAAASPVPPLALQVEDETSKMEEAAKKRGRQRMKPPPRKEGLVAGVTTARQPAKRATTSLQFTTLNLEETQGRAASKAFKDYRAYSAILESMLSGSGTSHVSALERWMSKAKQPPETVAYCLIQAIKRHNSVPWISSLIRTLGQAESSRRTQHNQQKKPASGLQALSINDKKLADLLEGLLSQGPDWKDVPAIILSQIKMQLSSAGSQEISASQREALSRWAFYLCRQKLQPRRAKLVYVKQMLLIAVRHEGLQANQSDQGGLMVFVSLAMVWPSAFKKVLVKSSQELDRILQAIFHCLLWKSSIRPKIDRLLEQCLDGWHPIDQQPSFDLLVREQLGRLTSLSLAADLTPAGIRLHEQFLNCVQKFHLLAVYCNEKSIATAVESPLISITRWCSMSAEESEAEGGMPKLIADIILVSNVALLYPSAISVRLGDALNSLKLVILGGGLDQAGKVVTKEDRVKLICAAVELLINLSTSSLFRQLATVADVLKEIMGELEKQGDDRIKQHYRRCYVKFCSLRKLNLESDK